MTRARCIGIDGCPGGWVGATRDGVFVRDDVAALLEEAGIDPAGGVVAIDIPIGLPDRGRRRCDALARDALGAPRHNSVFWTATREAVAAPDQARATDLNRARGGPGVSAQAFHLFPRIRAVDRWLADEPAWRSAVHEVHPELAFAAMNGPSGQPVPMPHAKKSALGAFDRLSRVFHRYGREPFESARARHARRDVADHDIADAFAALFSAERIAAGEHVTLPDPPPRDGRDLPMRICY